MVDLLMLIVLVSLLDVYRINIRGIFDNKLFIWVLITFNITNINCYRNIIYRG
jgi:hypothetical protein